MTVDFYGTQPSARTSWRLAVLMGANSRTYKFSLGAALLGYAAQDRTEVTLEELAAPYAMGLLAHLAEAPQAPSSQSLRDSDFLALAKQESEESTRLGHPTDRLLHAAVKSMPEMVMQKFHNLRGGTQTAHRFYELAGTSTKRIVRLTADLRSMAQGEQTSGLRGELDARWNIVESSFAAGIGRSLMAEGVAVDLQTLKITDKLRRRSVTGVIEAVVGFQHGRCLICTQPIGPDDKTAVDHVFPFSLMKRMSGVSGWRGPDLDVMWNLAPAHKACNSAKSDRLPTPQELHRLAQRNEAIMQSPHPLRRTLQLSLRDMRLGSGVGAPWPRFLRQVQTSCD
ncbi:HNH endonuclease [Streptomyces sp. 8ZJF_21]|uniref:HNH endonuclease n=1 Tax=Streptomyces sp. 8ZJF_21 TaxID=2903141 RepID=UPI001E2BB526|nr:HNH endonuclease domain-containing protein [Streptomyces sp. 8ZJF_21]MCD9591607.1 HNH endonuclease [Streptomyces sp. 8ZJF_21]